MTTESQSDLEGFKDSSFVIKTMFMTSATARSLVVQYKEKI